MAASIAFQKSVEDLRPSAILIEGPYDFNPKPTLYRSRSTVSLGTIAAFPKEHITLFATILRSGSLFKPPKPYKYRRVLSTFLGRKSVRSKMLRKTRRSIRYNSTTTNPFEITALSPNFASLNHLTQINEYRERASLFSGYIRKETIPLEETIRAREAFMAYQIRLAQTEFTGTVMVVTGGYHSSALQERISKPPEQDELYWENHKKSAYDRGIALTPYSNSRLDSENGYTSGTLNPGFYDFVWESFQKNKSFDHRPLVHKILKTLRKKEQQVNSANRIVSETMSRALADLRGHKDIWRRDLIARSRDAGDAGPPTFRT
ncbi:hypothetical protein LEP1GSC168_0831 [Leptospira santarosai str. HAI134]|nr:hypothetical protein LEP1GSC168_0831 [Leptospira santarosai str. HAI134]